LTNLSRNETIGQKRIQPGRSFRESQIFL